MINFISAHLKSLSSYCAVLLTLLGTLMAAGVLGQGSLFHVVGYLISVLTVLGFKALPQPATQPATTPTI